MPTPTYVPLATLTLASADSSIVFSSIPASYRDLILVVRAQGSTDSVAGIRFNGDSTSGNYSVVFALGDGSSASSGGGAGFPLMTYNTSTHSQAVIQVMDYSATDKHKTALARDNESGTNTIMRAARWANTSAITSMEFYAASGNFSIGSTFSLYGVN